MCTGVNRRLHACVYPATRPATIADMAKAFEAVYTDEQRDAIATAYEDRRIRPARRVVELAEAGELAEGLAAFTVHGGANTVRDFARKLRRRRSGQLVTETAKRAPRDAIESLRVRLISVAEIELTRIEREQKKRGAKADPERIRQLARAIREAAAIPTRDEVPTPKPGYGGKGERVGAATRTGPGTLAGSILADVEAEADPTPMQPTVAVDPSTVGNHEVRELDSSGLDGAPGDWAREQIGTLPAPDPRLLAAAERST
jgi:hypothetical protein